MSPPRTPMMAPKVFWDIVESARHPRRVERLGRLHELLITLGPDEVVGFDNRLRHFLGLAHRRDLYHAARLMRLCGGEDGFRAFCCWLVAQGREAFEQALEDPDSLADLQAPPPSERDDEPMLESALYAWQELTGGGYDEYDEERRHAERTPWPALAEGGWDFNDWGELRKRLPRISAARFGGLP